MNKDDKIFLAGHKGLVGSALHRKLIDEGFVNIVVREHSDLDLTNQKAVEDFFAKETPNYVILSAAKVGGIIANSTYPADFLYINIMIASNVINASYKYGVKKLLNLGSSCIYPKNAPQPMSEDCLLTSSLEETNEAYAIAKISAIKLCHYYNKQYGTNFISVMPTNQYGQNDNYNMETAHLLPMLLRRFHLAKLLRNNDVDKIKYDLMRFKLGWNLDKELLPNCENYEEICHQLGAFEDKVIVWGTGNVYRELMFSDDLADACIYLMNNKGYNDIGELVNITSGEDILLNDLFEIVKTVVGFDGKIIHDTTKPDGTFRKKMDASKIKSLGWSPKTDLKNGIEKTYRMYCES